jgi:hypothetical protein
MNKIKFSDDYYKLPVDSNGTKAKLVHIERINLEDQVPWFIRYDTDQTLGRKYDLPSKGEFLLLLFKHESGAIFTTLRRDTYKKYDYYKESEGEWFEVVIG